MISQDHSARNLNDKLQLRTEDWKCYNSFKDFSKEKHTRFHGESNTEELES
jgi:hypothetical protein